MNGFRLPPLVVDYNHLALDELALASQHRGRLARTGLVIAHGHLPRHTLKALASGTSAPDLENLLADGRANRYLSGTLSRHQRAA